jgi:hypothetical protein
MMSRYETGFLALNTVAPLAMAYGEWANPHRATQQQLAVHCGPADGVDGVCGAWCRIASVHSVMSAVAAGTALRLGLASDASEERNVAQRKLCVRFLAIQGIVRAVARYLAVKRLVWPPSSSTSSSGGHASGGADNTSAAPTPSEGDNLPLDGFALITHRGLAFRTVLAVSVHGAAGWLWGM